MERIGELVDGIYDEVDGAERYAKRALKAKTDGEIAYAKTYAEMANQELWHADRLHDMAVSEIKLAEQQGREAPDGMRKVWDWEHGRIVDKTAAVRNLLANTSLEIWEAVNAASLNPARRIGVDAAKGSLEAGKDADIAICDADFNVRRTILGGRTIYTA